MRIPQRAVCCNHTVKTEPISLSGAGKIYEAVHIFLPPKGFDEPFWAGFIDLEEGPRFFAQIACAPDEGDPQHGEEVEMVIESIGSGEGQVLAPVFRRVGSHVAV
ncbi:Zn-ribbon domain-containing OB-fold protein [Rhodococcus globerulus]|uniref:Zn-ribbon domain-containing OB-fold protein n=1 Tax=Rhodococcus globerulus TaxID=33008 RepID=UPI00294B26A8|nr:OB-fold domain-containing protein [Rhodococcus globerulus]